MFKYTLHVMGGFVQKGVHIYTVIREIFELIIQKKNLVGVKKGELRKFLTLIFFQAERARVRRSTA